MPKEQRERRISRGLIKIINPENIIDMDKYCREKDFIVKECYGYYHSYCLGTCTYAKKMDAKIKNE